MMLQLVNKWNRFCKNGAITKSFAPAYASFESFEAVFSVRFQTCRPIGAGRTVIILRNENGRSSAPAEMPGSGVWPCRYWKQCRGHRRPEADVVKKGPGTKAGSMEFFTNSSRILFHLFAYQILSLFAAQCPHFIAMFRDVKIKLLYLL